MTRTIAWWVALGLAGVAGGLWLGPARLGSALRGSRPEATAPAPTPAPAPPGAIGALGRLEPDRGVRRVAGPPRPAVVIEELRVEEGDPVRKGDVLAVLAGIGVERAEVERLQAELANAERELERHRQLRRDHVLAESEWQALLLTRDVARASLSRARASLELSTVRSPIDGRVLEIHAREGERVGAEGVAAIGATNAMFAVAEVYETDIGRVRLGQRATVRSPALPDALGGVVERIGLRVGKNDVLSTDPVADVDARVVEVEIRLDDPELAASLTNLRVDVVIGP